ncbi:MAG: hypothetical protein HZB39_06010 [Planctomycetes bacterium]|nr:hypothetical protein [Planctomycetota bacterium]
MRAHRVVRSSSGSGIHNRAFAIDRPSRSTARRRRRRGKLVAPRHLPADRYEFDVAPDGTTMRVDVSGSLAGR